MEMYRQGGVLLVPVGATPPGREAPPEAEGGLVLAFDEDTPVCTVIGGGAILVVDETREWYLTVTDPEGVDLVREGRATVRVRPGSYRVALQCGYQYWPGKGR